MTDRTAFYAGSFDPLTNGHLDVLKGALELADTVVIGIGIHPGKKPLFSYGERVALIERSAKDELGADGGRIKVVAFDNLVIDAARVHGASIMIRGLRDGTDLDYEMQMAGMNQTMAPELLTVFLPASPSVRTVTATLVRQIASMGGNVAPFVPAVVAAALKEKFSA
ncbi:MULTISPECIES: pantetheine-phosphate adenylyltransferase [Chelativorans]|jgi:pantetheine-phosphate adenylyltransferase|uniref:Phosphopantetheine adenylyltransferase n=1 Tax=Chelativorans sp. (strain BNC1) TaxID=266779 RepID=COAD_CHESB|nr:MULTISPECIES: pantetheine-phosphate adenylyltransferase [Chelativorans]Q11IH7.1 RecName: Full=Phosphopantetheine adenylyltransferase; AltName: Full=Dephospho-CoA pyrophosphorylase; AltName: Full=Pantetheine-phosphate adenylyltransferase; Short=PPAT [Chelativorans sp. BNC1]